jgi:uncharacterized SAM-binding protein YcdF (DUF218 family)
MSKQNPSVHAGSINVEQPTSSQCRAASILARLISTLRFVLLTTGALLLAVTFTPIVQWTTSRLASNWNDSDGDVLIVLAGSTVSSPALPSGIIIGHNSYLRVLHSVHVWRTCHFRKILVCGAGAQETIKPVLAAFGIPEAAIIVENRSTTTRENALFAKPILARLSGRFVLLTSDYHSWRATRCFAHEGIPVVTRPCPDLLKSANSFVPRWQCFWTLADEIGKIIYYWASGWI